MPKWLALADLCYPSYRSMHSRNFAEAAADIVFELRFQKVSFSFPFPRRVRVNLARCVSDQVYHVAGAAVDVVEDIARIG